jgi:aspartate/methionine/tyrosine aminotransferase
MRDLGAIINRHRDLDLLLAGKTNDDFISDWDGQHPFYKEDFSPEKISIGDIQGYNYIRGDLLLKEKITTFHEIRDHEQYTINEILPIAGSTTGILAFITWLRIQGITEIYYVPPLYFTFHYFFKILDINVRPVSSRQMIDETKKKINWPSKKCVLIVTDPVWYAGVSLKAEFIEEIKRWQQTTGSYLFVDGSFQYLSWKGFGTELSGSFDKSLTFRLICPTKALATHGFRFSYLLIPQDHYDNLDFILDNSTGSSSIFDIRCSHIAMDILNSKTSNSLLANYISMQYSALLDRGIVETLIAPNCGYFVFAKIDQKIAVNFKTMDGKYFEQGRYKDYVRINLLSNSVQKLLMS